MNWQEVCASPALQNLPYKMELNRQGHIAFNVLNNHKTFKAGMKRKQKKVAMNTDYLSELLMAKGFS